MVKLETKLAGILYDDEDGYSFTSDLEYYQYGIKPLSLTLPLLTDPYHSKTMIPFFDVLMQEGWLLDIHQKFFRFIVASIPAST